MTYEEKIAEVHHWRLASTVKSYHIQFKAAMRATSWGLCKSAIRHALNDEQLKIGIVGTRRRDSQLAYQCTQKLFLRIYHKGDIIISGGCPEGGDRFAELIAAAHGLTEANGKLKLFRPNWKLGRHAGFLRNTDIARCSNILIAVVAKDRRGGTEDTISKFKRLHPKSPIILLDPLGRIK